VTAVRCAKPPVLERIPKDRHAILAASAGTGKTFTLEHLIVELLLTTDTRIEQLLVVTYTEKATAELVERIQGKLVELLAMADGRASAKSGEEGASVGAPSPPASAFWVLDAHARERLTRALEHFDRAAISTIHGFCQRTLRENAFDSRLLFATKLVASRAAFRRVFRDVLRRELAVEPPLVALLEPYLAGGKSVDDLEQLLFDCASKSAPFAKTCTAEGFDEAVAALVRAATDPAVEHELRALKGQTLKAVRARIDAAAALGDARSAFECIERLKAAKWEYFDGDAWRQGAGPALVRCVGLARSLALVSSDALVAQAFLPRITRRLEREKLAHGAIDFDDMIRLVDVALERDPALVSRLRSRYRYALIDEFQDTDPAQWRIFRRVFFDADAGHAPRGAPRNVLYVVGDPKQAIYSFRGADIGTYLEASRALLASGSPSIDLRDNYRSTSGVIDAYNAIFEEKPGGGFFRGGIRYDAPVRCGRPELALLDEHGQDAAPLVVFELPGKGVTDVRPALYEAIADEVAVLLAHESRGDQGASQKARLRIGDREKGELKAIRARDIFVLVRKREEATDVAKELAARGIPHAFYKQAGLYETAEARDIADLLDALADPKDRDAVVRALLTRFFDYSVRDLEEARELPATHPAIRRIHEASLLAWQRRWEALVPMLLDESGIVRRLVFYETSERKLTNYEHLFEIVLERAHRGRPTPPELASWFRALLSRDDADKDDASDDLQRLESERSAVQIMTMHASKGLEAAVVFVAGGFGDPFRRPKLVNAYGEEVGPEEGAGDGDASAGFGDRRRLRRRVVSVGRVPKAVRDEVAAEADRLMYVALTRARGRLYLPFAPEHDASTCDYARVHDRLKTLLDDDAAVARLRIERRKARVASGHATRADAAEEVRADALRSFHPPARLLADGELDPMLERLARTRVGAIVTSYTQLRASSASGYRGDASPFDATEEKALEAASEVDPDPDALPPGAKSGILLHSVLERVPLGSFFAPAGDDQAARRLRPFAEWWLLPAIRALVEEELGRHRFEPRFAGSVAAIVHATMSRPLRLGDGRVLRSLADGANAARELEVVYPIPEVDHPALASIAPSSPHGLRIDRGYVRGLIDLAFEHEGRVHFVDYKSDSLPSWDGGRVTRHVANNYGLQAVLYALGVVRMLRIRSEADYEARFGGYAYVFLRGMLAASAREAADAAPEAAASVESVVSHRPTFAQVLSWEEALRAPDALERLRVDGDSKLFGGGAAGLPDAGPFPFADGSRSAGGAS
jgi:exodeoxyribonuclease V beta subunit